MGCTMQICERFSQIDRSDKYTEYIVLIEIV